MAYCHDCGAACTDGDTVPLCPRHGPRWKLGRNAPCASVIVVRDGEVLLSRRANEPWIGEWEVPGGFVELGEHPADAARREAHEELGVEVTLTGLVGQYVGRHGLDGDWIEVTTYLGETTDDPTPDPLEVSECGWFAVADLPAQMAGDHRRRIDDWLAGQTVGLPSGCPTQPSR